MNKEVEEALKKVLDYAVSPQYENVLILKQAFRDMELQLANANAQMTIQSKNLINVVNENVKLINYNLELKSKLDKYEKVFDRIKQILKEE